MKLLGLTIFTVVFPLLLSAVESTPAAGDTAVVATIDGKQITVGDFVAYYQKRVEQSEPDNRPSLATFAEAQQMLNDLLNARAVLISAEKEGYDKRDEFQKAYTEFRAKTLLNEFINRRQQDLTVTQAEVEDFYQHLNREYHISLILLYDEEEAKSLMPKLRQPDADFVTLAKQYTRDPSVREEGGRITEAIKYSPQEPWITISGMSKGEISDPLYIPTVYAWGIFRVDDITEVSDLPPLDKERDTLALQIRNIKKEQIEEQIRKESLSRAKVKRDEAMLNVLFTGDPTKWSKPGMTEKTVSTVDGQPIAFGELLKFLRANFRDPAQTRSDDPTLFKQLLLIRLGQLEKEQAVVNMCLEQGLDKEPEVAARLEQFREKELVMEYLRDNVESKIPQPTEEQIAAYYEEHKGEDAFQISEKVKTTILISDKKERLEEARERIAKGEDVQAIVDEINQKVMTDPTFEIPPTVNPVLYKPVFLLVQTMDSRGNSEREEYKRIRELVPGSWSEIFPAYDRFLLGRLDEVLPPREKTLTESHETIYQRLKEQIEASPQANLLCENLLKNIRNRYQTSIDESKLEAARQRILKATDSKQSP